ncbi:MAG: glycosyltransferase family 2 protein [Bacteroidales bacterium]|jgi:glycosyltransferase involved in cell wall biosynthesis|nr:glycosyltransferase family 2 protein [Bacteroidales bacterium]
MTKISAVIITKNEECNIERCLQSLQDAVDEIIVVDSGSTDRTEEICKQFQVKFIKQNWLGYGEQKNYGNQLAQNNWILSIDADEALSEDLKKSILDLKKNMLSLNNVYSMNRLTNYCGSWIKHCGWYPDNKVRLFSRTIAEWNNAQIHERLIFQSSQNTMVLKGDLLHYSFYSISAHITQINKFTSIAAAELYKKGKKSPSIISILLRAKWKFVRDYIFNLGFLDGYAGYLVCKYSAMAKFTKYAKLRQLHNEQNKK